MTAGSIAVFGALCAIAGAVITFVICACWVWRAMGEHETVDTSDRCVECGKQHMPLYDGECIPCRFGRDLPAVHDDPRCVHGVRLPHECKECAGGYSDAEVKEWMRSQGLGS